MTYPFTRTLTEGNTGQDVYRMQYALNAVGRYYLISSCHCEADGIFLYLFKSSFNCFNTSSFKFDIIFTVVLSLWYSCININFVKSSL